jgi:hypothetical protein
MISVTVNHQITNQFSPDSPSQHQFRMEASKGNNLPRAKTLKMLKRVSPNNSLIIISPKLNRLSGLLIQMPVL